VTLDVFLTFTGYNSLGVSYWLELPNTVAPFISITEVQYFTFPHPPPPPPPITIPFNSTVGARPGYLCETTDLGATVNDPTQKMVPPGTYHINAITFSIGNGIPLGGYAMYSTSNSPRISEVTDTDFNDNNIIPPGQFTFTVPEPRTASLISFAIGGASLLIWRRKMK
jgi:hypothetical protein